jgi:4,5-DOPA dioxygenase extradiol
VKRTEFLHSLIALGIMGSTSKLRALSNSLKENGQLMPALFIGHGSPQNALEQNEFTQVWQQLGKDTPQPKAVLCISAHWLTKGTHVTAMNNPKTIHDFGGFSDELNQVKYPAPGDPELAKTTKGLITSTEVGLDHDWGLDHGTWSIAKQMYPNANIPVLQLSIDYHKSPKYHYDLSMQLYNLRKKGVLIIGSGNLVHNLRKVDVRPGFGPDKNGIYPTNAFDWALEFNDTMKAHLKSGNFQGLIDYEKMGKTAKLAHPTPDHYYPLLYTLGVVSPKEQITFFNDKVFAGSLSMTSVKFG